MAETALTPNKATRVDRTASGATVIQHTETAADNTNGNSFANTGRELVVARNTSGGALTVSFKDKLGNTPDGTKSIPAGKTAVFGPFRQDQYNDASGNVRFTASAATINIIICTLDNPSALL